LILPCLPQAGIFLSSLLGRNARFERYGMAFPGSFRAFVFILAFFQALRLEAADAARLYRDAYGVPHVFADSMAAAYYGGGYAMGEDLGYHASQLALAMEGRKAELLDGSSANIRDDIEARLFRFYATARERFGELSPEVQLALRSFAAGLARAYAENPAPRPGWAIDVTAEHLAASFLAANFYQSAFEASAHELKDIGAQLRYPYLGSNAWAAAAAQALEPR